jgi:hypothetical protein
MVSHDLCQIFNGAVEEGTAFVLSFIPNTKKINAFERPINFYHAINHITFQKPVTIAVSPVWHTKYNTLMKLIM